MHIRHDKVCVFLAVYVYVCGREQVSVHRYVCVYVCVCVHVCVCAHMCVHVYNDPIHILGEFELSRLRSFHDNNRKPIFPDLASQIKK